MIMKTLHLPLKAKWFNMYERDEKPEEYRDITPYWQTRLASNDYTHVCFHYGYTKRTMIYEIKEIVTGYGNPDWGAPTDREVYIIKLGKRI